MRWARQTTYMAVAIALGVSACTSETAPQASGTGTVSTPSSSTSSPAPSSGEPSIVGSPAQGDRVTGLLGFDDIEGGCAYVEADDGTRYEVMYPDGWELTESPLELRSPDGDVVARAGDEVTVVGEVAADMASICQIGPIFRATDVEA